MITRILSETLDNLWNAKNYGGSSEQPRKDFAPQSNRNGYDFPYQRGGVSPALPTTPETSLHFPHPLENLQEDFAACALSLMNVGSKMAICKDTNKSLAPEQIEAINKILPSLEEMVLNLKELEAYSSLSLNLAGHQPALNPQQEKQA
jgi:hypothetical protein